MHIVSGAGDEASEPKLARWGAEMPKHGSDERGWSTAVLRAALNGTETLYVITLDTPFLPYRHAVIYRAWLLLLWADLLRFTAGGCELFCCGEIKNK